MSPEPRLRFLVDACVDVRIAGWLRGQGHDALHLRELGLQDIPDMQVFAKAMSEGRIVGPMISISERSALLHSVEPRASSFSVCAIHASIS